MEQKIIITLVLAMASSIPALSCSGGASEQQTFEKYKDSERYSIRSGYEEAPWGDYGSMLGHGMGHWEGESEYVIERTGPFAPGIFRGGMQTIVRDSQKEKIERSGLTGVVFLKATKGLIVEVDWRNWDLGAEDPEFYPPESKPEYYVWGQPNSVETADAMGDFWVLSAVESGKWKGKEGSRIWITEETELPDVVLVRGGSHPMFSYSEKAKAVLEGIEPNWIRFVPYGAPKVPKE